MLQDGTTRGDFDRWIRPCALVLAVGWLALRAPALLFAPRFWAEESAFVSAATRLGGLDSILFIYWRAGYFSWPPSLGATLGVELLPLALAPAATTLLAFLLQLSPFLAMLFVRFDFPLTNLQRSIAAMALLTAATTGQGFAWLNTLSSQMHLGILTSVLMLAAARQATPRASWLLVLTLLLTGLSGAYSVFLFPVFLAVAVAERDVWRMRQALALAAALAVQSGIALYKHFVLELVTEKRGSDGWALESILDGLRESVALPMFGQRAVIGGEPFRSLLLVVALLVMTAAIAVLVRSARSGPTHDGRRLAWWGSVDVRGLWAWLATVGAIGLTAFEGIPADRYAIVPGALTVSIVGLAFYRTRSRALRILLGGVLATCIATGLWSPRYPSDVACDGASSGWQAASRAWSRDAVGTLPSCPEGWSIEVYPRRSSRPAASAEGTDARDAGETTDPAGPWSKLHAASPAR